MAKGADLPQEHPRQRANDNKVQLDIISDSSLCLRPSKKPRGWKFDKGVRKLQTKIQDMISESWQVSIYAMPGAKAADLAELTEQAKLRFAERQAASPDKIAHFAVVSWCCNEASS